MFAFISICFILINIGFEFHSALHYCRANKNFMRKRLNFFIELTQREGFFENDNGALACEFFNAIAMLGSIPNLKQLDTISEPPFRLPESHQILQCAHAILVQSMFSVLCWLVILRGDSESAKVAAVSIFESKSSYLCSSYGSYYSSCLCTSRSERKLQRT